MRIALLLAEEASAAGEVPVGCVVCNASGEVIGRGRNRCMEKHDATAHAEMEAIREASAAVGDWRLDGCTLFVTLEPCPMCAGAIMNSRIFFMKTFRIRRLCSAASLRKRARRSSAHFLTA